MEAQHALEYDLNCLAHVKAGDKDHYYPLGPGETNHRQVEEAERIVAASRGRVEMFESLLSKLPQRVA